MVRARSLLVVLVAVALPACAKHSDERKPAPLVTAAPPFGGEDSIPAPRLIPPAAELYDGNEGMEIFCIATAAGNWKFQHPDGRRVANDLHLPVGRPIRLVATATDRSGWLDLGARRLEIPAFPIVIDVWPGRYTGRSLIAKRTGEFGIWGSGGNRVGTVIVLEADAYDRLANGLPIDGSGVVPDGSLADEGRALFLKLQCGVCHNGNARASAPNLEGLFGTKVALKGGGAVVADEAYIRESILKPKAKVVDGWEPVMPAYEGQVTEADLVALVAYLRSLKRDAVTRAGERSPAPVGAPSAPRAVVPTPRPR